MAGPFKETILSDANAGGFVPASKMLLPNGSGTIDTLADIIAAASTAGTGKFLPLTGGTVTGTTTVAALTTTGAVKLTGLPTADPHVVGQLWLSTGVLTVSAG